MTPAHALAAQACLGILRLLHLDKDFITHNSLDDFTLAKYAAVHWTSHAWFEYVSRKVEDVIKLKTPFRPKQTTSCSLPVWIDDLDIRLWEQSLRNERPLPPRRTPLYYASFGTYNP